MEEGKGDVFYAIADITTPPTTLLPLLRAYPRTASETSGTVVPRSNSFRPGHGGKVSVCGRVDQNRELAGGLFVGSWYIF